MTLEQKIARINELYKKSKSSEGLTEAEKSEQALLRKEYIDNVRQNLRNQLNNINIQDEDGSIENLGERYGSKNDQMEFFRITDRAELAPGYQHILEPPGQTKRFLPDASIPTLLTAPGLAFDRSGARIGYGKGFYDRYLGKIPAADRPYLVGLCFSCQLFEILDGQKPHDINMDLIVTERR